MKLAFLRSPLACSKFISVLIFLFDMNSIAPDNSTWVSHGMLVGMSVLVKYQQFKRNWSEMGVGGGEGEGGDQE